MNRNFFSVALAIIYGLIVFAGYGMVVALCQFTFIDICIPVVVTAVISIIVLLLIKLRSNVKKKIQWYSNLLFIFSLSGILLGLFYTVNFYGYYKDTATEVPAVIEKIVAEKHYRSKRVAPRRYSMSEPYTVYKAMLKLNDGHMVHLSIDSRKLRKFRPGDSLRIVVAEGFFEIPVVLSHKH